MANMLADARDRTASELDAATRALGEAREIAHAARVAARKMSARAKDHQAAVEAARNLESAQGRYESALAAHAAAAAAVEAARRDVRSPNEIALASAVALADDRRTKAREAAGASRAKMKAAANNIRATEFARLKVRFAEKTAGKTPRQWTAPGSTYDDERAASQTREKKAIRQAEAIYRAACLSADQVREASVTAAIKRWRNQSRAPK